MDSELFKYVLGPTLLLNGDSSLAQVARQAILWERGCPRAPLRFQDATVCNAETAVKTKECDFVNPKNGSSHFVEELTSFVTLVIQLSRAQGVIEPASILLNN